MPNPQDQTKNAHTHKKNSESTKIEVVSPNNVPPSPPKYPIFPTVLTKGNLRLMSSTVQNPQRLMSLKSAPAFSSTNKPKVCYEKKTLFTLFWFSKC
jgi:hypothetical protein